MLETTRMRAISDEDDKAAAQNPLSAAELIKAYSGFFRRQFPIMLFVFLLTFGLGAVYLFTATPKYTGTADLLIDSKKSMSFQQSPLGVDLPIDSATVDSQVEILKSENIGLAVIKDLHLADDPEFTGRGTGIIGTVFDLISSLFGSDQKTEFERTRQALGRFQNALSIKRIALTYVIEIGYQSYSAERAAQIANAVADAYVVDALEAKYQATRRAGTWLQDRLKDLRAQASAAERTVVDFKAKNNIVDTGGRLLNEQQLSELNSALIMAQAQAAESQARMERVFHILDNQSKSAPSNDVPIDATVTDTLHNDVVTRLRQQYLDLSARESDWSARYGRNHLAAVNVRNQMQEIRRSIHEELRRTAETYKSDYEIAKSRVDSIQKSLGEIISQSNVTNQAQIVLRELDSTAQSYRALADNFLQLYMQSVQQQSFPMTEARLITQASTPLQKSSPKTMLVLAVVTMAGLIFAAGAGGLRDLSDQVFRTSDQVENSLRLDAIAVLPAVKGVAATSTERDPGSINRVLANNHDMLWHVVDAPFSRFAESVRSIKVASDLLSVSRPNKVIGITSSLPNEGKSTVSGALAQLMAQGGSKVILVDCDLRNPAISRHLAPGSKAGLLEILSGKSDVDDAVWSDPQSTLAFLPVITKARLAHSSDILSSVAMREFFEKLREKFDYVIVDLPPLAPIVDVRATSNFIDSYVFVVEWGQTKIDLVRRALQEAPSVYNNVLGVVLNKANLDILHRYQSYQGGYYQNRYYARYGYTD
jgi:succinoglycan biosynthesis transport protein ExoP